MGNQFDICGSSDMALEFVISKNNYIICLHCYKSLEIEYMSNVESSHYFLYDYYKINQNYNLLA